MKRSVPLLAVGVLVLGSGAALGVTTSPTRALDRLAQAQAGVHATPKVKIPTSAIEVNIALKELAAEKGELEAESADIDKRLEVYDARLLARGKSYYREVHAGLLPAGGGFEELVDHAARVEKSRLSILRDLDDQKKLRARRDEISERLSAIAAESAPLEAQKQAFASAETVMRQADERRAAFDRAFDSEAGPSDAVVYGAQGPSDAAHESGFASLMGHLPFPVAGRAEIKKIDGTAGPGTAIELHAPPGAGARSVAAGRVVFADRYEDERITVILDHGDRYFTLYGNLTRAEVKAGENIASGAALGTVATRKGESVLIFEIRKEGRAVEASPWFGL